MGITNNNKRSKQSMCAQRKQHQQQGQETVLKVNIQQQLMSTIAQMSVTVSTHTKSIHKQTSDLQACLREIIIPDAKRAKGQEFKNALKAYGKDLRVFCQTAIGSIRAQDFVEGQHVSLWLYLVINAVNDVKTQLEALDKKTTHILSLCRELQNDIKEMARIEKEARESRRKSWWIAIGVAVFCAAAVVSVGGVAFSASLATALFPGTSTGALAAACAVSATGGAVTGLAAVGVIHGGEQIMKAKDAAIARTNQLIDTIENKRAEQDIAELEAFNKHMKQIQTGLEEVQTNIQGGLKNIQAQQMYVAHQIATRGCGESVRATVKGHLERIVESIQPLVPAAIALEEAADRLTFKPKVATSSSDCVIF